MDFIILLIFGAIIAAVLFGKSKTKYVPPQSTMPDPGIFRHYEAKDSLFANRSELAFFHAMARALSPQYHLLTKPRLEDVIGVKADLPNPKLAFQLRGRVKSRHVDFLIMDDSGRPICAIELDGRSHKNKQAEAGDTLKDGIFAASGVPLHRVIVGQDFAMAAQNILNQISPPQA